MSFISDIKGFVRRISKFLRDERFEKAQSEFGVSKFRMYTSYLISRYIMKFGINEFFNYKLFLLNLSGMKQYMNIDFNKVLNRKYNYRPQLTMIAHKEEMMHAFQDFIKRDFCGDKFNGTKEDYERFSQKHEKCIVKPKIGFGGEGVRIISIKEDLNGESLYDFCHKNKLFAEELVLQHPKMASLHPSSVNTVRILMVAGKPIAAALRMGCGGSDVDNAHSGGFFAGIDLETGIVCSYGFSTKGVRIVRHPDTGTIIPGFEIPFFKDVLKLTVEASKVVDKLKVIGWDIAITEKGPVLIEVNDTPGGNTTQVPFSKGIRRKILDNLGVL